MLCSHADRPTTSCADRSHFADCIEPAIRGRRLSPSVAVARSWTGWGGVEDVRYRPAVIDDVPVVATMLGEAAVWRPDKPTPTGDEVMADQRYAMYATGWPRTGVRYAPLRVAQIGAGSVARRLHMTTSGWSSFTGSHALKTPSRLNPHRSATLCERSLSR